MSDRRAPLNPRKAVNLTVKLAYRGLDEFVEKYATNLSTGGMFIRTREPKALGTEIQFKVELAGGQRVLQGKATVRWVRAPNDPGGPPGMGLEFDNLDEASAALVKRMLAGPILASEPNSGPPVTLPGGVAPRIAPLVAPAVAPAKVVGGAQRPGAAAPAAASRESGPAAAKGPGAAPAASSRSPAAGATKSPGAAASRASGPAAAKSPTAAAPAAASRASAPASPKSPAPAAGEMFDELFGGTELPETGVAPLSLSMVAPLASTASSPGARPVAAAGAPFDPAADFFAQASAAPELDPAAEFFAAAELGLPPPPPASDELPIEIASPPSSEVAVDLDLDALVNETPAPRPPPPEVAAAVPSPIEVDIDVSADFASLGDAATDGAHEGAVVGTPIADEAVVDEPIIDFDMLGQPPPAAKPAAAPKSAAAGKAGGTAEAEPSRLPEARRAPMTAAMPSVAPVVLTQSGTVAPAPARTSGPVFLKPPATIEATGPVVGIDLGTSNSCCAVLVNGKPQILRSKDGYNVIPSIVALSRQGGLLVGNRAKSQLLLNPSQSVYGAKRLVGRDFDSETVKQVRERYHYQVVPGPDGKAAVQLGPHLLALEEVQGIVLLECKQMAEQQLGVPVSRAVITCPAYYSEQQRQAVRKAAAMAGLKVERVLNEPTAAALAYGLNRKLTKKVLVYDLGGGTFDATIMRIDDNAFEVLATGGDVFLGGLDFDNQVVDVLLQRFEKQHDRAFDGDPVALSRIAAEAERSKIALSERKSVDVHLPMLHMTPSGKGLDLNTTLSRDELNAASLSLVDRTIDVVKDALLDAKMKLSDLDDIVLVGGMSRMPLVREKLTALFGKPPLASVNADEAVALGAALYSGTVDKVSNVVLIDVVPMTIGIGLPGGGFKRIIERNTPLPVSKSFSLTNSRENEEQIELSLFQGEDANVVGNEYVGTTRIEGLPKGPMGSVQIAVTLKLDAECVLHVEARELRTRALFKATMATRHTSEEIRKKLGITPQAAAASQGVRAAELQQRGGKFWGFLKRVVGRA